jgi:hypothetical protein
VYARSLNRPKQRKAQPKNFPAPVGGWVSNRALATPEAGPAQGASILDNFFPRSTGVVLRRGKQLYATLGDGSLDSTAIFSYNNGTNRKLFAATEDTIYEITSVPFPDNSDIVTDDGDRLADGAGNWFGWSSTGDLIAMEGFTGGNWIVVQFATSGGVFLVGVNGEDDGFIYDGADFWPNYGGGLWEIPYDNETTPFTEGSVLTGATSGATALIWRVEPTRLIVRDVAYTPENWTLPYVGGSAAFTVGSTIRGETSKASARIKTITPGTTTWELPYDGGTGAFVAAEVVTGTTSGATATVVSVAGTTASGTLTVQSLSGVFQDNEALTGSIAGAASVNGKASAPILSGTLAIEGLIGSFVQGEALRDGSGGLATVAEPQTFVGGGSFQDNETITDADGGDALVNGDYGNVVPGMAFPNSLTTADMSYVWAYKNRLWFIQKNSLNAYYADGVDAIGGTAVRFPLDGVLGRGGSLHFGQNWSLEASAEGGLAEQCVFMSTEGEAAIYQGLYPVDASWSKVGVYRTGKPLGNRSFMRGGGDLAISTSVGLVPLSKAIQLDVTSLNIATVSYNIADAWSEAVELRGNDGWQAELWPELKMAMIAPPTTADAPDPVVFVSNTETGAWCRFTNWRMLCADVFLGQMFFGSENGKIYVANATGADDGVAYTGVVLPLYEDLGSPSALKIGTVGRVVTRASAVTNELVTIQGDFNEAMPVAPDATIISGVGNLWGTGVWGQSIWGGAAAKIINQNYHSVGQAGYVCSLAYQVTSSSLQPLDVELVRSEMLYTTAELVS